MSRELKIALGIIGGLVALCICAAGIAFFSIQRMVTQTMELQEDPEKLAELAREIVDYQLPPGYREQFGISIFGFEMVAFGPENMNQRAGGTIFLLAQFPKSLGLDQAEMERQMEESLQRQSGRRDFNLQVVDEISVTIRDQTVPLIIREGTDSEGHSVRQITGVFDGKGGTVMLMIMGNSQTWSQDDVDSFIMSLN